MEESTPEKQSWRSLQGSFGLYLMLSHVLGIVPVLERVGDPELHLYEVHGEPLLRSRLPREVIQCAHNS